VFTPELPYRCSPSVALRPEPFGALAYHFGTRRLCFLKSPELLAVVRSLAGHRDVRSALEAAGLPAGQHAAYLSALAGLAAGQVIEPRPQEPAAAGRPEDRVEEAA
jgi:putative mycofactocin binding protein MftB